MNTEREKFETWYRENFDNGVIDDSEFSETLNEYESLHYWADELKLNQSWKAWQAAKADAVPEGYVLMPKEPTDRMVQLGDHDYRMQQIGFCDVASIYKAMIEAQEQNNENKSQHN